MNQQKSIYVMSKTSSNMSRNFHLKHFHISQNTNKIAFRIIKQIMQAAHHLRCRSYAGYTGTSRIRPNHQSTDQQKMC